MKRKIVKIISILLMIMMIFLVFNNVFASSGGKLVKEFTGTDNSAGANILRKIIGPILNVVRIVATGISIFMITYLGIQYMAAAPTEKANIKGKLITFTIGAVVVVGAASLLKMIQEAATDITNA